jgi:hypothetical protein
MLDRSSKVKRIFQIEPPQHKHDANGSASSSESPLKLIATGPADEFPFYLAECDSEILLICLGLPLFSRITVYRLADLMLGRLVPVTSIGDNVLLVAERSLSVSSRVLPTVEGNSVIIYNGGEKTYFGQYQLSTSNWSPAADGCMLNYLPGPSSLINHIFTCCHRALW